MIQKCFVKSGQYFVYDAKTNYWITFLYLNAVLNLLVHPGIDPDHCPLC